MYKCLLSLLCLCLLDCYNLQAQQLHAEYFCLDDLDITANLSPVFDLNSNKKCALLKIHTSLHDLTFDAGSPAIVKVEEQDSRHPSEVWLYVAPGIKQMTISHPQYLALTDYHFSTLLQSAKTYHLSLLAGSPMNDHQRHQLVTFSIVPSDAALYVGGNRWDINEHGECRKLIPLGRYDYHVIASGHKDISGTLQLGEQQCYKKIILQRSLGRLKVISEPSGAEVKLSRQGVMGNTPLYLDSLETGTYSIQVNKQGYTYVLDTIIVTENQESIIEYSLEKIRNSVFNVKGASFNMIAIEGGTFAMGSTEADAADNEKPAHQVTLNDYSISETEVTMGLWTAVMGGQCDQADMPVTNVCWNDCQQFIRKLNKITGREFRLPTEAEWEYAAKGGNRSKGYIYSGSNSIGLVANYLDIQVLKDVLLKNDKEAPGAVKPAKSLLPNELGIYDMSGNLWEWCEDSLEPYTPAPQKSPKGTRPSTQRVVRGGGYHSSSTACRVTFRTAFDINARNENIGFRLAL